MHTHGRSMSNVREINDISEAESCRLLWNSLLPATAGASFFHSLTWLKTYWRHFGADQKLRLLVVSSKHGPVGILPLVVRTEATRIGRVRVLTYPLDEWGTFYGPIGPNPTATLLAGLSHIRRTRRDWDMLDLRWIDEADSDRGRTPQTMRANGFQANRQAWAQTAQVQLTGTWEEYWARRTSHWRTNYRHNERRLAELGEVVHVRYRPAGTAAGDDDPRWDLFDTCQQIARESWQGSSTTGTTISHESVRNFLRDAHEAAVKAGCVDVNLLQVGGRPVAFNYNYCYRGHVFGLRMGFEDCPETAGAGTELLGRMLKGSFDLDDHTVDLGSKYLNCKQYWTTSIKMSYRYSHFPAAAVRVQALRAKRWLRRMIVGENVPVAVEESDRKAAYSS